MKYIANGYQFESDSEYDITLTVQEESAVRTVIKICIDFHGQVIPKSVKIRWRTPCGRVYAMWNCLDNRSRSLCPDWAMACNASRAVSGMPLQCYIGRRGENIITTALSDVSTPVWLRSGVVEETAEIAWELVLFPELPGEMSEYSAYLLLDANEVPYQESINRVSRWWEKFGYVNGNTPPEAFDSVYSTWYSYHQNVTSDVLIEELKAAAQLGIKTVIVDDGWQTEDNGRGYAHCGIWKPAATKIADMKAFTEQVHKLGMKLMLWFSVPFVGLHSEIYERFKNQVLGPGDGNAVVLDPRYPEVRKYLIQSYEYAVTRWKIDGLKLDFIDSFRLTESSNTFSPEMDTASVDEGVCLLLEEVNKALTKLNPNILIEFRQSYIGPVMLKYGNMLRAADCPMDAPTNRVSVINLRMTSGNRAVHSDMLMWELSESAEKAAAQVIAVLFSVPQISVRINELPEAQYQMLKHYLEFWQDNREVLTQGDLKVKNPEANYSIVVAEKGEKAVAVAYSESVLEIGKPYSRLSFINGTSGNKLYIENNGADCAYHCRVYDCTGKVVLENEVMLTSGINAFEVPFSGLMKFRKKLGV